MWPFKKKSVQSSIQAKVSFEGDVALVDVRGQTCPGYLLAINKAVDELKVGTRIKLIITYPPCGDDVKAWAKERKIKYLGIEPSPGKWIIDIQK